MVRGKNKYCIIKFLIPILLIIKRTKIENINNNMKINEFFIKEKLLISIEYKTTYIENIIKNIPAGVCLLKNAKTKKSNEIKIKMEDLFLKA